MIISLHTRALLLCNVLFLVFLSVFTFPQGNPYDDDDISFEKGAVVSNGLECAKIGAEVLKDNGSAVDAAIATLFCEGVTGPQSMGIGGGFLATIYDHESGNVTTLNAREAAPANSSEMMFKDVKVITGGLASAIPGELKGYKALHEVYGKLPWSRLVQPTIELCEKGHKVDKFLDIILKEYEKDVLNEPTLREIFADENGNIYKKGDTIRRPQLAKTLRIIAEKEVDEFYNGELGRKFIEDVQSMGGILTMDDLKNYKVRWNDPIINELNDDYTMYSIPIPGSGTVLSLILNILKDKFNGNVRLQRMIQDFNKEDKDDVTDLHVIAEGFKHGYAVRMQLADNTFENVNDTIEKALSDEFAKKLASKIDESMTSNNLADYNEFPSEIRDKGTANLAVLAPNGDAITVTSTINSIFGGFRRSRQTGIIINDEMDDFSTPNITNKYGYEPSPLNFIKPGKRPMSSMTPTIILDKQGNVRLLVGAAGGSQITTSVALTMLRHFVYKASLDDAINTPRFHHQLLPMELQVENTFDLALVDRLKEKGHTVTNYTKPEGFSAVTGISVENGKISPVYDLRRGGSGAVYDQTNKKITLVKL